MTFELVQRLSVRVVNIAAAAVGLQRYGRKGSGGGGPDCAVPAGQIARWQSRWLQKLQFTGAGVWIVVAWREIARLVVGKS